MFFESKYYLERVRNAFADGKQLKRTLSRHHNVIAAKKIPYGYNSLLQSREGYTFFPHIFISNIKVSV